MINIGYYIYYKRVPVTFFPNITFFVLAYLNKQPS